MILKLSQLENKQMHTKYQRSQMQVYRQIDRIYRQKKKKLK